MKMCLTLFKTCLHTEKGNLVVVLSFIKMYFCQLNLWLWMLEDIREI